jgi:hypothetical protein
MERGRKWWLQFKTGQVRYVNSLGEEPLKLFFYHLCPRKEAPQKNTLFFNISQSPYEERNLKQIKTLILYLK